MSLRTKRPEDWRKQHKSHPAAFIVWEIGAKKVLTDLYHPAMTEWTGGRTEGHQIFKRTNTTNEAKSIIKQKSSSFFIHGRCRICFRVGKVFSVGNLQEILKMVIYFSLKSKTGEIMMFVVLLQLGDLSGDRVFQTFFLQVNKLATSLSFFPWKKGVLD